MEITLSRPWVQVFKFLMVFSVFLDFAAYLDSFAGARNDRRGARNDRRGARNDRRGCPIGSGMTVEAGHDGRGLWRREAFGRDRYA